MSINILSLATASIKLRETHKHANSSFTPTFTKVAEVKVKAEHNKEFMDELNIPSCILSVRV